jgi:hypothetical protein
MKFARALGIDILVFQYVIPLFSDITSNLQSVPVQLDTMGIDR